MLRLGTVRLAHDEIRWIRWSVTDITLGLRWSWDELPVLLDMTEPVLFSWQTVDDAKAGFQVRLRQGRSHCRKQDFAHHDCLVELVLERLSVGCANGSSTGK